MSLEQLLLRDDMWMGHSQRFTSRSAVDTGYEPLNTSLLNRGWPLGSLVEICQQGMQGEWQLFTPGVIVCALVTHLFAKNVPLKY